jgi:hypothetical protein
MNAPEYCLFYVNLWPMCMTKSEWSGWVQAVGSIAALLFAFYLMRYQLEHARIQEARKRHEDLVNRVAGIATLLRQLSRFLGLARTSADELSRGHPDYADLDLPFSRAAFERDFLPAMEAMGAIPIHEFGHAAFFVQAALQQARVASGLSIDHFNWRDDNATILLVNGHATQVMLSQAAQLTLQLKNIAKAGTEIDRLVSVMVSAAAGDS